MAAAGHHASTNVKEWPQIRAFRALLRVHARLLEEHRRYLSERHGLLLSEFDMIAGLGNTKGLRMGELASAMITSAANVTRVAQALEKRGLVERGRADHSDREVIARLTPAGEAFFREHFLAIASFSRGLMDSGLTVAEQKHLGELLGKLNDHLEAPSEPPPSTRRDRKKTPPDRREQR
jgi:DNA-binding MarR family transcriptional regulator